MGHLESGRAISVWQRDIVINQLCRPVLGWVMQAAQLSGRLRTRVPVQWVPPRREMVDPTKEIPMLIQAIRAGLVTFPSAIQSMGGDPDEHLLTLKETMDQLKTLGLTLTIDPNVGAKIGAK
ncbi:MAG: hypothetical protein R3F33_11135 [Planctomycetota bacterium]